VGGVQLDRDRLTALLEQFGEYPAKYRLTIWWVCLCSTTIAHAVSQWHAAMATMLP
jgi:hypothetical protein